MDRKRLILSLFPGIDLFSKPFEERGFCVVRGPDLVLGQDIRDFHVPAGIFAGIIGGPPCQDFSGLRRDAATGYGLEMQAEYQRIVEEGQPDWWLMENVPRVPNLRIDGWSWQRFDLNQCWFSDVSRLRHFQFGSKAGIKLNPPKGTGRSATHSAATASDDRSFSHLKYCQGLPESFDLPSFTVEGKKRAVGNGVPLVLGRILAALIDHHVYGVTDQANEPVTYRAKTVVTTPGAESVTTQRDDSVTVPADNNVTQLETDNVTSQGEIVTRRHLECVTIRREVCACGCGRVVTGKAKYSSATCRKRKQRERAEICL